MKKNNAKDNFARKYWKTFEKLVIRLLKEKLGANNTYEVYAHKTPDQNDGGYDGIIFIEPTTTVLEKLETLYTILTEAKLRQNANKDLPLSDFSKTLIIAINRCASEVYVYTNLHFSFETYKRVEQFSSATSLKVKLIDIFELCDELNIFSKSLEDFPTEFIHQLHEASKLHSEQRRINYKQENIFENSLPPLIGDERNNLLNEYIEYFKTCNGIFIITGIQGCGKRLFIKHVINSLQYTFNCRLISLEKFTTIKGYFVYLLSLIWNIDPVNIYDLTENTIDEIMECMPVQYYPQRVKSILLNILKDIPTEYESRQDVLEEHLIEYLYYIFIPICKRKKQLFAFVNFNKTTDNILNFTNKFIRKFSSENLIILTELQSDDSRIQGYIDEWALLNPAIKPIRLSEFNYLEYIQYMNSVYPEKSQMIVNKLYSICYPLPIYIDNLISIIDNNNLEMLLCQNELNISKLYNNVNFRNKLILYSVKGFFFEKSIFCKRLAYIIVFFDGELSLENIKKLGDEYLKSVPLLVNSIYFDLEKNYLQIHHILYLKAFQNDAILSEYEYNDIMGILYNVIDEFVLEVKILEIKKLELAIILHENDYVLKNWEKICNTLILQNDFSFGKQLLKAIFQKNHVCFNKNLKLINSIIKCYLGLNEYKSAELLSFIQLGEYLKNISEASDWKIFCYLKARCMFSLGKYQEIVALTDTYKNEDPDLRYIRALSIKHIYGIDECILSLERGKKHFPYNWHLQYAHLDHLHSKYEKIDFEKSWEFLLQIKYYYNKLSLEDQIHFQYNKIALEMYKTKTTNINICNKLFCKTFENILPVEMARTHNLLGQIYLLENNIESAIKEFESSLELFKKNVHITYLFVPLMNLALIYDQINNPAQCLQYTMHILKYLEEYKKSKIKNQLKFFDRNKVIEKECAAFILSMELIKKSDMEIYNQYLNKFPNYNLQTHSSSKLPQYYRLKGKFTFRC